MLYIIGQCPAKNRVMSNECCFKTATALWQEVKKHYEI